MGNTTEIYNWLIMAFSEPTNSLTETFYYDRRDSTFYSIHFADYFLVKEDFTLDETVNSGYTPEVAIPLADRMRRWELKDGTIVSVPTLPVIERKAAMSQFVSSLQDASLVKILDQRIKNQNGTTKFDFYFGPEADEPTKTNWTKFKYKYLQAKIDTFMNLNRIDIETSLVWDIGENFSISLNLTNVKDKQPSLKPVPQKRWWKFW
jgi:hypothetical protein